MLLLTDFVNHPLGREYYVIEMERKAPDFFHICQKSQLLTALLDCLALGIFI